MLAVTQGNAMHIGICSCCGVSVAAMKADGWEHHVLPLHAGDVPTMERHSWTQRLSLRGVTFDVTLFATSHPAIDQKYFGGAGCFSFHASVVDPPGGVSAPDVEGGHGSIFTCMTLLLMPGGTHLELQPWQRPDESRLERYARVLTQQRKT